MYDEGIRDQEHGIKNNVEEEEEMCEICTSRFLLYSRSFLIHSRSLVYSRSLLCSGSLLSWKINTTLYICEKCAGCSSSTRLFYIVGLFLIYSTVGLF